MKSARINFGIPNSEYIVQVDDTGAATSCYNQDTETEYVGGGEIDNGEFHTTGLNGGTVSTDLTTERLNALISAGVIPHCDFSDELLSLLDYPNGTNKLIITRFNENDDPQGNCCLYDPTTMAEPVYYPIVNENIGTGKIEIEF